MRQVTALTATYSSDVFGICSALYELGGMVVMHDASGCNSTYTTHDEPRWYERDSMIYVSAISEREAILGNDEKLIDDLVETAKRLHPKFIAIVLAPIPYMIGTDVDAIARIVTARTGIPCFGFPANGMHDYTRGVSQALERIVRAYTASPGTADTDGTTDPKETRFADGPSLRGRRTERDSRLTVNLLGVTPLDFGMTGSVEAMRQWITDCGMQNGVCLAMGCTPEDIVHMADAQVNLVVSSGGLAAARWLRERFGMPYVVGVPYGSAFSASLAETVSDAAASGQNRMAYLPEEGCLSKKTAKEASRVVLIGEAVTASSLAAAIGRDAGVPVRVLCPLETESELLRPGDLLTPEEDDLMREIEKADVVIADPLYRPLCGGKDFYPLPHPAFSGRMYEKEVPNLMAGKLG